MPLKERIKKCHHFANNVKIRVQNPVATLRVTGEDAWSFLQGQFSQELRETHTGRINYGFWLTAKGKVAGDATIVRTENEAALVFSWSLAAAALQARLEAYIIADDVELADETPAWRGWQLAGPGIADWAAEGAVAMGWCWRDPRELPPASATVVATAEPVWPEGAEWADDLLFEQARIAAGVPVAPIDLGEGDLPQEAGKEAVGVSFTKGCYLGQEVMARLQAMGRARRALFRVGGDGPVPEGREEPLTAGERKWGELRSRVEDGAGGWIGLAMGSTTREPVDVTLPDGRSVEVDTDAGAGP